LGLNAIEVAGVGSETVGLRQDNQVLVSVQFPEVLDVTAQTLVAIVEGFSKAEGSFAAGSWVGQPIGRMTNVRHLEGEQGESSF
jgi:hypothetical protein